MKTPIGFQRVTLTSHEQAILLPGIVPPTTAAFIDILVCDNPNDLQQALISRLCSSAEGENGGAVLVIVLALLARPSSSAEGESGSNGSTTGAR
jgi:hypothetical protein